MDKNRLDYKHIFLRGQKVRCQGIGQINRGESEKRDRQKLRHFSIKMIMSSGLHKTKNNK